MCYLKSTVKLLLDTMYLSIIVQISPLVFDFYSSRVTQPASGAWLQTCCELPGGSFVLVRLRDNIQELPLEALLLPGDYGSVLTQ